MVVKLCWPEAGGGDEIFAGMRTIPRNIRQFYLGIRGNPGFGVLVVNEHKYSHICAK